jgi:uncharacterized protein with NRDE domain
LVLAHRVLHDRPVVLLANRDEMLDRPASAPGLIRSHPAAFGGRDQLQGGTWFGINEVGLVVGLTNLAGGAMDPSRRSRGLLVVDLLGLRSAREVADAIGALGPGLYNGFNVMTSDGAEAWRAQYDERPFTEPLQPGVHACTNWRAGVEGEGKAEHARQKVQRALAAAGSSDEVASLLQEVSREHEREADPRYSLCCHYGAYGTRSSTILIAAEGGALRYLHSEGAPCVTAFEDHSSSARAVLAIH